jgi:DNA-binding XRE family transcriptional regulator
MFIASNLVYLRLKFDLKRSEIANAIGCSRQSLVWYEIKRSEPNLSTTMKISDYFNIPVDDLLRKDFKSNVL